MQYSINVPIIYFEFLKKNKNREQLFMRYQTYVFECGKAFNKCKYCMRNLGFLYINLQAFKKAPIFSKIK